MHVDTVSVTPLGEEAAPGLLWLLAGVSPFDGAGLYFPPESVLVGIQLCIGPCGCCSSTVQPGPASGPPDPLWQSASSGARAPSGRSVFDVSSKRTGFPVLDRHRLLIRLPSGRMCFYLPQAPWRLCPWVWPSCSGLNTDWMKGGRLSPAVTIKFLPPSLQVCIQSQIQLDTEGIGRIIKNTFLSACLYPAWLVQCVAIPEEDL